MDSLGFTRTHWNSLREKGKAIEAKGKREEAIEAKGKREGGNG